MQLGKIIGHATATIKHPSLRGRRMALVQPLNVAREPDADPVLAIDPFNVGIGCTVVLCSDGKGVRQIVKHDKSPARWFVLGVANA